MAIFDYKNILGYDFSYSPVENIKEVMISVNKTLKSKGISRESVERYYQAREILNRIKRQRPEYFV